MSETKTLHKRFSNLLKNPVLPPGIKAVIFDLDGTLIDSEPLHFNALKEALASFIPVEEILIENYIGVADLHVYEQLCVRYAHLEFEQKLPATEFLRQKSACLVPVLERLTADQLKTHMAPDLPEFLELIKSKSLKTALVSASEVEIVELTLKQMGLASYFFPIVGRQNTFLSKPSSSPYLQAMRALKSKSSETLIFEDSPTGLEAARETGAHVYWVHEE